MHEFSLAQGLMRQLLDLADQHNAKKILTVRIEIGSMAGIVADSFAFAFEVLAQDNPVTKGAVLELNHSSPQHICLDCGEHMPFILVPAPCARCGSTRMASQGGDDLILTQVEME